MECRHAVPTTTALKLILVHGSDVWHPCGTGLAVHQANGEFRLIPGHPTRVRWLRRHGHIAASSDGRTIAIWNLRLRERVTLMDVSDVHGISLEPAGDHLILLAWSDTVIMVYRVASEGGTELLEAVDITSVQSAHGRPSMATGAFSKRILERLLVLYSCYDQTQNYGVCVDKARRNSPVSDNLFPTFNSYVQKHCIALLTDKEVASLAERIELDACTEKVLPSMELPAPDVELVNIPLPRAIDVRFLSYQTVLVLFADSLTIYDTEWSIVRRKASLGHIFGWIVDLKLKTVICGTTTGIITVSDLGSLADLSTIKTGLIDMVTIAWGGPTCRDLILTTKDGKGYSLSLSDGRKDCICASTGQGPIQSVVGARGQGIAIRGASNEVLLVTKDRAYSSPLLDALQLDAICIDQYGHDWVVLAADSRLYRFPYGRLHEELLTESPLLPDVVGQLGEGVLSDMCFLQGPLDSQGRHSTFFIALTADRLLLYSLSLKLRSIIILPVIQRPWTSVQPICACDIDTEYGDFLLITAQGSGTALLYTLESDGSNIQLDLFKQCDLAGICLCCPKPHPSQMYALFLTARGLELYTLPDLDLSSVLQIDLSPDTKLICLIDPLGLYIFIAETRKDATRVSLYEFATGSRVWMGEFLVAVCDAAYVKDDLVCCGTIEDGILYLQYTDSPARVTQTIATRLAEENLSVANLWGAAEEVQWLSHCVPNP
ncbi:hypothetical protein GMRT_14529 [Giardia muris]|uniref:WD40 repeat protein n=1 Tax=Giardia muris TaxID=5742 RepID=A0A4Z1T7F5_GIAMU|nr:hypothetical protein GMRT_14529 [Giardia muris]|eukprot:TNJ29077.1 hypothetical protein GMRT_14529 [Giardia muris]